MKKRPLCLVFYVVLGLSPIYSQNADINLLRSLNINRNTSFDPALKAITNSTTYVSLAAPILVYSAGWLRQDTDLKQKGIYLGESLVLVGFTTMALKYSIKRPRPHDTYPEIENITSGGGYSFPSGHTSLAFATATSLSIAFPKWYVVVPSYLWATSVGYSRMGLGVHYPSDVLAGAVLGSASAYFTYKLNHYFNRKANKKILYDDWALGNPK